MPDERIQLVPRMRPILLLELNEIPWRVWDLYLSKPGFDGIKTFFNEANQWTTIAQDKGELSPWITWPTLHRGINNSSILPNHIEVKFHKRLMAFGKALW